MRHHAKTVPVSLAYSMMITSVILIIIAIVRMLRRILAVSTDPGQFLPRITLTSRSPAHHPHNSAAGNGIASFRRKEAEMRNRGDGRQIFQKRADSALHVIHRLGPPIVLDVREQRGWRMSANTFVAPITRLC